MRDIKPNHSITPKSHIPETNHPEWNEINQPNTRRPAKRGVSSFDISRKAYPSQSIGRRMRKGSLQPEAQLQPEPTPELGEAIQKLPPRIPVKESKQSKEQSPVRAAHLGVRERAVVLSILAIGLVAALLAGAIFLPKAKIELTLKTAPLLLEEEIKIAAEGGGENTITGTSFFREIEVQGTVQVQGKETIGEKARGTVKIINRSFDEQKIIEHSRLVTTDGQLFYLDKNVTVPAASASGVTQATATVEAAVAGPEGNIEPQRLNFAALSDAAQALVYAETTTTFTGGSGEEVQVVSEADIESARQAAAEAAKSEVEVDIRSELPEGWTLLDESWNAEIDNFTTTPEVGTRIPELTYSGRITMRVFGYEQQALEDALAQALESHLEDDYMLFPGPISFSKTADDINWEDSTAIIKARVTHTTIPKIAIDTLTEKLAGQSESGANQYLEGLPGVQQAKIDLWPFWVSSVPRITGRITLDLTPERQP